jgi:hypothetical protein
MLLISDCHSLLVKNRPSSLHKQSLFLAATAVSSEEEKLVELLKGKVEILQEVVDELHLKEQTHIQAQEEKHEENLKALKEQIQQEQTKSDEKVSILEMQCQEKEKMTTTLTNQVEQLEISVLNTKSLLTKRDNELVLLEDEVERLTQSSQQQLKDLSQTEERRKQSTEIKHQQEIEKLQVRLKELDSLERDQQDRMEIATAAVQAAQSREEDSLAKKQRAIQKLKQAQFQALIYQKVSQSMVKALSDEEVRNENLKKALELQKAETQQVRERYRPKRLWRGLFQRN